MMENAQLSAQSLRWLYDAARWAKFIAIVAFIGLGLLVIVGFVIGPAINALNNEFESAPLPFPGTLFGVIYLVVSLIYFFPFLFLYQFANGVTIAYKTNDEEKLNASLVYIKKHFNYIGVLLIILLSLYALLFIIGILGASFASVFA